jgi:hypothetical protein
LVISAQGKFDKERIYNIMKANLKWSLVAIIIILVALAAGVYVGAQAFSTQPQSIPVSNLFVDIDGNGQLDLIVSGEVILNSGSAPLAPVGQ